MNEHMKKVRIILGLKKRESPLLGLRLYGYEGIYERMQEIELRKLVLVIEESLKKNFPGVQVTRGKITRELFQEMEYSCRWGYFGDLPDMSKLPDEPFNPPILCRHPEGPEFCDGCCPLFEYAVPLEDVEKRQLRDMRGGDSEATP